MIVRRALEEPIRQIVENAGAEGSVNNNYLIDTPGRVIHHLRDAGGFPRAAVPTMVSGVGRQRLWDEVRSEGVSGGRALDGLIT